MPLTSLLWLTLFVPHRETLVSGFNYPYPNETPLTLCNPIETPSSFTPTHCDCNWHTPPPLLLPTLHDQTPYLASILPTLSNCPNYYLDTPDPNTVNDLRPLTKCIRRGQSHPTPHRRTIAGSTPTCELPLLPARATCKGVCHGLDYLLAAAIIDFESFDAAAWLFRLGRFW